MARRWGSKEQFFSVEPEVAPSEASERNASRHVHNTVTHQMCADACETMTRTRKRTRDQQQEGPTADERERGALHAARRLSARNTHVLAEDKKRKKTPHAHPRQKNRHKTRSNTATKTREKGKRATQQTGPTTTEEQQKQQQKRGRKRKKTRKNRNEKEPTRPPGPLQTTQGQDQRKDLDPGVGMQGARGSNIQSEQETLQKNPWPKQTSDNPPHQHPKKTIKKQHKGGAQGFGCRVSLRPLLCPETLTTMRQRKFPGSRRLAVYRLQSLKQAHVPKAPQNSQRTKLYTDSRSHRALVRRICR